MKRRRKPPNRRKVRVLREQRPVPLPPACLANDYDNSAIEQLRAAPSGTLELDRYAQFLIDRPPSDKVAIAALRGGVIEVYGDAARARVQARAGKETFRSAEAGLISLWKAVRHLEDAQPQHSRGLRGVFALPADDPKGLDEVTAFSAACSQARSQIIRIVMDLDIAVRTEKAKPSTRGERKKRLRILTEGLAAWWIRVTGKRIAPYVQTKPWEKGRTFIARRSGTFVEFAVSVLTGIDRFTRAEVISAVTNVYEQRRRQAVR